jgi:hypothetical protein
LPPHACHHFDWWHAIAAIAEEAALAGSPSISMYAWFSCISATTFASPTSRAVASDLHNGIDLRDLSLPEHYQRETVLNQRNTTFLSQFPIDGERLFERITGACEIPLHRIDNSDVHQAACDAASVIYGTA